MRTLALVILSLVLGTSCAETVPIFGLPLGGKPVKPIPVCKFDDVGSSTKLCFLDKPFVAKDGRRLGSLNVPDKNLPAWARFSTYALSSEKDGRINSISTTTDTPHKFDEIKDSISLRFGAPTSVRETGTLIPMASWELRDILIHITQYGEKCCEISFRTPDDMARQKAYWAERDKEEKSRPLTP